VSKARLDFPEPLTPVTTVIALWGISKLMFFRLWTRAPRTRMVSCSMLGESGGLDDASGSLAKGTLYTGFFAVRQNNLLYVAGQR
jgi:hypothetical protein